MAVRGKLLEGHQEADTGEGGRVEEVPSKRESLQDFDTSEVTQRERLDQKEMEVE